MFDRGSVDLQRHAAVLQRDERTGLDGSAQRVDFNGRRRQQGQKCQSRELHAGERLSVVG